MLGLIPALVVAASGHATSEVAAVVGGVLVTPEISKAVALPDSFFGRSGKLRMRIVSPAKRDMQIGILADMFGDTALKGMRPSVRTLEIEGEERDYSVALLVPFKAKVAGKVGTYRIGTWPSETKPAANAAYRPPEGFIEVTPDNQNTRVSESFRLRDFLTKDQSSVWPKYLVLREALIDKLELVIDDLRAHGYPVKKLTVMSGFRTPQYNAQGVGAGGRASSSRHMYGDAADVYVDNEGKGWMSDLNRDGRVDTRDSQIILDAAERVEKRYPDLVGGGGLYKATSAHGPFAHIDVRGVKARWTY